MSKKKHDEDKHPGLDTPTHINGSEVTTVSEPNEEGKCDVYCKDGKGYVWHSATGAVYPAGHPKA